MIVYKVQLPSYDNRIKLPKRAKLLDVQLQDGTPTMWYAFEAGDEEVERQILMLATGQMSANRSLQHIASLQSGPFVWHYFENLSHVPVNKG